MVVGLLFKTPGPIQDYIRECEEQVLWLYMWLYTRCGYVLVVIDVAVY